MNELASERVAVLDSIDPDANAAGTINGAWISTKDFHRFLVVVQAGALGTNATIDADILQATDASGTGAKVITGKSITQLTDAGSDDDKQALINLKTSELDVDGGFSFVRARLIVGTATSDSALLVLGVDPRYGPASDFDAASVDSIAN